MTGSDEKAQSILDLGSQVVHGQCLGQHFIKEDRSLVSKQRRGIEMFLWASRLDPDRNVGYRGCLDAAHEC